MDMPMDLYVKGHCVPCNSYYYKCTIKPRNAFIYYRPRPR